MADLELHAAPADVIPELASSKLLPQNLVDSGWRAREGAVVTVTPQPRSGSDLAGGSGGLVVLCGRSFSGKTTVAGWLRDGLGGDVVSFDAINETRGLRGGDGIPLEQWIRTSEIATRQVQESLQHEEIVIVDDTSSPRSLRDRWRSLAAEVNVPMVLVLLDTAVSTTRQRQTVNRSSRTRPDVTDAVMDEHLAGFQPPGPDEPAIVLSETATPAQVVAEVTTGLGGLRCRDPMERPRQPEPDDVAGRQDRRDEHR